MSIRAGEHSGQPYCRTAGGKRREKGVIGSLGSKVGTLGRETVHGLARRIEMLDALFLVAGVVFFAMSLAYVTACDRM
jgi:hypothetical protein